jgi:predicted transcriptional regulator
METQTVGAEGLVPLCIRLRQAEYELLSRIVEADETTRVDVIRQWLTRDAASRGWKTPETKGYKRRKQI